MLDKTYSPAEIEAKHYDAWERSGAFACVPSSSATPFAIVIPPPNVTGTLHMGHAVNNTLQDILVRYRRKQGRDALWQVGTDHAGIATQMVVERQLRDEGTDRREIGREAFIARIWRWREESGGAITNQLRRLGASLDWSRERFTMDEGLSNAVRRVFVRLHKEGLLYRDKRLVNWDCKFGTAISDLEVEQREVDGFLWYIKYPVKDLDNTYITVATTRPETMLGDTGVAVHPEDPRFRALVGKKAILPLVGRELPIVADPYSDPEKGSGAVKITPAHDFNDFEVGKRHDLPVVNVLKPDGRIIDSEFYDFHFGHRGPDRHGVVHADEDGIAGPPTVESIPERYRGLDRFEARKRIVADLEAEGRLEKIEPHRHVVPYGDRSNTVIEPRLTDQWFVDAATLAKPAIEAVEKGRITFVPGQWAKSYFEWMRNIQPWCVSRQIWWGHQIPAWYGPDGKVFVEETEAEAAAAAAAHYGRKVVLTRDADVLHTWFSSGLWPFSTLGWPDETPELKRYYPTDVLVTGFDIIFFWVARMIMLGLYFMNDVPFRTVYIHALVRDEKGQKMSKSKGNVIDPIELMDKYGADALRFTLAAMAAQGRDIRLSEKRVEGYRNFATKLWNAARFCEMNECLPREGFDPAVSRLTLNRWIVGELAELGGELDRGLEAFRFNDAANAIYRFTWGSFCDWYLELIKPILYGPDGPEKDEVRATAGWALGEIVNLLHPFMPFITEELWARLGPKGAAPLIRAPWPELDGSLRDPQVNEEISWIVQLISEVRTVRAEMNVPAGARIPLKLKGLSERQSAWLASHREAIVALARLESAEADEGPVPKGSVQLALDEASAVLPLSGIVDLAKEQERLAKELDRLDGEIGKLDAKLANAKFIAKAPVHVVEKQRERRAEAAQARTRVKDALARLEL